MSALKRRKYRRGAAGCARDTPGAASSAPTLQITLDATLLCAANWGLHQQIDQRIQFPLRQIREDRHGKAGDLIAWGQEDSWVYNALTDVLFRCGCAALIARLGEALGGQRGHIIVGRTKCANCPDRSQRVTDPAGLVSIDFLAQFQQRPIDGRCRLRLGRCGRKLFGWRLCCDRRCLSLGCHSSSRRFRCIGRYFQCIFLLRLGCRRSSSWRSSRGGGRRGQSWLAGYGLPTRAHRQPKGRQHDHCQKRLSGFHLLFSSFYRIS